MYKFAAIGALIAALAVPASAAGQRVRSGHSQAQAPCREIVVFRPGRNYAMCNGRFWIRDPQTGNVVATSFWRLQQPADQNLDRP
jgi:hypothetical protein